MTCVFEGGSLPHVDKTLEVVIVDDVISEHEEVFLLVLKVVHATEGIDIDVERNVSVIRIRQDTDGKLS